MIEKLTTPSVSQLGNTDLPVESPNLSDPGSIPLELLQKLHHILLEVRSLSPSHTDFSELRLHQFPADLPLSASA